MNEEECENYFRWNGESRMEMQGEENVMSSRMHIERRQLRWNESWFYFTKVSGLQNALCSSGKKEIEGKTA